MSVKVKPRASVHRVESITDNRAELVVLTVIAIGIAVPMLSSALGLHDHIEHWGKLVHAVDGFCAALSFGLLLLGWREYARIDLTDELAALVTICAGVLFGVLWEIVEFIRDWVANSDLQKSNADTMTDFLCNDLAVIVAAIIAIRIAPRLSHHELGETAEWFVDGPSRVLDRHGVALGIFGSLLILAAVASLWFSGRPVPGIPIP